MAKSKSFRVIIAPGDGFHGCALNFSDLCEEAKGVGSIYYNAYEEYTSDEYKSTKRMKKGGGLERLIDCGDAILEEVFGSCKLY